MGFDGKQAVYIGIQVAPAANLLEVVRAVHKIWPDLHAQLPRELNGEIVYNSTEFVHAAIYEVVLSLVEALIIVTLVVFLFLGSVRSALIPTIAIPLSLVGTLIILSGARLFDQPAHAASARLGDRSCRRRCHHRVENINRHLEEGVAPIPAAIAAARELGWPIIAMTVVLAPYMCQSASRAA